MRFACDDIFSYAASLANIKIHVPVERFRTESRVIFDMPLFGVQSNQDVGLTEEEIDDILYLSRTGELDEIKTELSRLQTTYDITIATILDSIIDPLTGNGSFHLSGANGHTGEQ